MLREHVPRPRQGHRGGLVPGHVQRHDLVAHLPRRHPCAVVRILRLDQDREEIAAILAAGPARLDDAVDERVQLPDGPARAEIARRGNPVRHDAEALQADAEVVHQHLGGLAGLVRVARDVGVE